MVQLVRVEIGVDWNRQGVGIWGNRVFIWRSTSQQFLLQNHNRNSPRFRHRRVSISNNHTDRNMTEILHSYFHNEVSSSAPGSVPQKKLANATHSIYNFMHFSFVKGKT